MVTRRNEGGITARRVTCKYHFLLVEIEILEERENKKHGDTRVVTKIYIFYIFGRALFVECR